METEGGSVVPISRHQRHQMDVRQPNYSLVVIRSGGKIKFPIDK